jgi:hypothetical protein
MWHVTGVVVVVVVVVWIGQIPFNRFYVLINYYIVNTSKLGQLLAYPSKGWQTDVWTPGLLFVGAPFAVAFVGARVFGPVLGTDFV